VAPQGDWPSAQIKHNERRWDSHLGARTWRFFRDILRSKCGGTEAERFLFKVKAMRYEFLVETNETERVKVVSVWSEFRDEDLGFRPNAKDLRGRSVREQMVHQCVNEDLWLRTMLGIEVGEPPLPAQETRLEFMKRYTGHSGIRLARLRTKDEAWWEGETMFFDVKRSRAWVMTRRIAHTAHHRGQQMAMLRMLAHDLHSNYGPTADTGGLMQNHAPTIYAYPSLETLLQTEAGGGHKSALPGGGGKPVTERP
jgi:uncharacterized damage-inducible protein DinB